MINYAPPKNELILVLGGARSGKSSWALHYTEKHYNKYLFLATAETLDQEMKDRVQLHKAARGQKWQLVEESINITEALQRRCSGVDAVLIDCLTVWLSNILLNSDEDHILGYQDLLLKELSKRRRTVIMVANEVGSGIVPEYVLGRKFRDIAGTLNQNIAALADKVILSVAGLPIYLKGGK